MHKGHRRGVLLAPPLIPFLQERQNSHAIQMVTQFTLDGEIWDLIDKKSSLTSKLKHSNSSVEHNGEKIVALITENSQGRSICRFTFGRESFRCGNTFQILEAPNYIWFDDSGGSIPRIALHLGGRRKNFIGRVSRLRDWEVGTIVRAERKLIFLSFRNGSWSENSSESYQVLCLIWSTLYFEHLKYPDNPIKNWHMCKHKNNSFFYTVQTHLTWKNSIISHEPQIIKIK